MWGLRGRRWDKWDEKVSGDSETKNWFMANTKPCPKCQKPVEKNGGCNHVVCKCGQVRAAAPGGRPGEGLGGRRGGGLWGPPGGGPGWKDDVYVEQLHRGMLAFAGLWSRPNATQRTSCRQISFDTLFQPRCRCTRRAFAAAAAPAGLLLAVRSRHGHGTLVSWESVWGPGAGFL